MPARSTILFSAGYYYNNSGIGYVYSSNAGDIANSTQVNNVVRGTYVGIAGTCKRLTATVATEGGSTGRVIKFVKNGTPTSQTIPIANGATGTFSNTSNADSMAVGDVFDITLEATITNTWAVNNVSIEFEHATNCVGILANWFSSTNNVTTVRYSVVGGYGSQVSTEADVEQYIDVACTMSRMSVHLNTNTRTTALDITLRKNNADTAITYSVPSATTGRFTDTTHTAAFAAGDRATISWLSSTGTGSWGQAFITTTADYGSAADDFILLNAAHTSCPWGTNIGTRKATLGAYLPSGTWNSTSTLPVIISPWTLIKSRLHVLTNATTGNSTFSWRKNDVAQTALDVVVPSATTGHFTTTGSASYAANDNITMSITTTTTGALTARTWAAVMTKLPSSSPRNMGSMAG
jgi:hypothetical protein